MNNSKRFRLSKEDLSRILRNIAIIYSPVILMFLDQIQAGTLDYKILYALGVSVTIDVVRRLLTDYTK